MAPAEEHACWRTVASQLQGRAAARAPRSVRQRGATGTVVLHFRLDAAGVARDVRLESSSGHALLDAFAQDLVKAPFVDARGCTGAARWPIEFRAARR